ncbi:MAG: MFS transporter [Pseudomonadota bacterium]
MTGARPRLGWATKLGYATGGIAYGVKGNGFSYFLMFCYSQAFGLPPEQVGFALLLAFLFDAFSDPVVGYISDKTKSPLGRRHPFMVAAIVPVGIVYWLLWNPPDGISQGQLFWYLVVCAVGVRLLITLYEVPCTAMNAELTQDYDERTGLLTLRAVVIYIGGVIMAATTLGLILQADETGSAFTDADGFGRYGLVAACAIMASMVICILSTRHFIPHMHPAASVPSSLKASLDQVWLTLKSPSLGALFISQLAGYAAFGIGASLIYYMQAYFWEFTSTQSAIITVSVLIGAVLALIIGPTVAKRLGKRNAALILGGAALVLTVGPTTLRLFGLMPPNGSDLLFWVVLAATIIDYACVIGLNAVTTAMFSDLVEEAEIRSGQRSEGLLFAVMTFSRKSVEGVGLLSASVILALINFPESANPGEVPTNTIFQLGAFYAPAVFLFWAISLVFLSQYRISRKDHETNLAALAARSARDG